jgi:phospholipid/cholesterol/gamma-HCH transport system substrate-binding protein
MRSSITETILGAAIVLVAISFLIFGYLSTEKTPLSNGTTYKAIFESVDGIVLNSEVRVGGVCVGTVTDISLDDSYRVVLKMRIQKKLKFPDDSTVCIATIGVMGEKFIEIKPGGSGTFLENDGTFIFTKSAINLEGIINKLINSLVKK